MRRLAAAAAILAALFVGGETAFRLRGPVQDALVYQDSDDPVLRFELRPGAEGLKGGAWVRINAQGLRERDIPEEKSPGEYRVLVVGDHTTFGFGVANPDVYVRQLEGLVRPPKGFRTLTTINLSMYHYNLRQKIELLRARGLRYHPDLVLFQVSPDDGGSLPPARFPFGGLKNFIRAHSRLLRWAMERLYWSRQAKPALVGAPNPGRLDERIREVADLLNGGALPGLVVYFPNLTRPSADPGERMIEGRFRDASREAGLQYYDAEDAFKGGPPVSFLQQPALPFLNAGGHRAAARGIAERIRKMLAPAPRIKSKAKQVG